MASEPARKVYRTWIADSRRWAHYKPRQSDIVIATYPKCGTTWMQRIIGLLIFQTPEPQPIGEISAWIDRRLAPIDDVIAAIDAQTHRRFLKSHMPFDGMPIHDDVRYIHVARDGRDACLSYHNQISRFRPEVLARLDKIGAEDETLATPYPRVPAEAADYFHMWINQGVGGDTDGTPFVSYFGFEKSFWAARKRRNMLLVHYRDLKADLAGEMRRIAKFLDIDVANAIFPDLVKAATFEEMRRVGEQLHPRLLKMFDGGVDRFFHKGENERWRGVFSESDLALYERKVRETLTPSCASYLERGRLATCDPRDAAD